MSPGVGLFGETINGPRFLIRPLLHTLCYVQLYSFTLRVKSLGSASVLRRIFERQAFPDLVMGHFPSGVWLVRQLPVM